MCNRVARRVTAPAIREYFPNLIEDGQVIEAMEESDHVLGVGVFPESPIVYLNHEDMKPHLRLMEWGVIRSNDKKPPEPKWRNLMVNIRSERVWGDEKSYWYNIRDNRCLIPLTGTFEYRKIEDKKWKKKIPYFIKPCDQSLFFLPGLYSVANIPDVETGEVIERWTYGLMTTAANDVMKNIHNEGENKWRQPLFLPMSMSQEFLQPELSDERYKELLAYQIQPDELQYHTVATIGRNPRADGLPWDTPFEWAGLPELGQLNPV